MAPEVVTDGHADPRSDIYSLGVVLFEAATGRLPFYGDSPYQRCGSTSTSRRRAPARWRRSAGASTSAIARALAKDPLDRFATAEDLAARAVANARAPAAALAPRVPARRRARACRRCGGWLVERRVFCADCGAALLRLVPARRRRRAGDGPGTGDKIDARGTSRSTTSRRAPPRSGIGASRRAPRFPSTSPGTSPRQTACALIAAAAGHRLRGARRDGRAPAPAMPCGEAAWQMTARYAGGPGRLR